MKKTINSFICCEDSTLSKQETASGFEVTTDYKFKKVKVIAVNDSESEISVGDEVLVSKNAGEIDPFQENVIIIRREDIIYIA